MDRVAAVDELRIGFVESRWERNRVAKSLTKARMRDEGWSAVNQLRVGTVGRRGGRGEWIESQRRVLI